MPCGLMDDFEGEVIGEEILEGGFENRLRVTSRGFESHTLRQKPRIFRGFFRQNKEILTMDILNLRSKYHSAQAEYHCASNRTRRRRIELA